MTTVGPGLRERKKAETRQAISDAALALAVEHGPAAVTVDLIARAADVSPRTVFNHYGSKEAAILGLDPERRQALLRRVEERPAGESPLVALREAMRASTTDGGVAWRTRARLARDHPQIQAAYVAAFTSLEDDLTAAVARRTGIDPATDPYPRLVVAVAIAALRVAVDHALDRQGADASAAAVDDAFARLAAGLPAPRRP